MNKSPEEHLYHASASQVEGAEESQMFGKPCYKVKGKAFCCFFHDEMVFKLKGEAHSEALAMDGAQLFDPSGKGRAMKEWVQLPFEYKDMWEGMAASAAEYVIESQAGK